MGFFEAFGGLALALLAPVSQRLCPALVLLRVPASPVRRAQAFCARTPPSSVRS